jgi:nicotinate-nucleotide pyrophosphorylase (carboxylating)
MTCDVIHLIERELAVDQTTEDATVRLLPNTDQPCHAEVRAKADGIFSGTVVIEAFSRIFTKHHQWECLKPEGACLTKGDPVVRISGPVGPLLSLERTLLNLLCHLCGVATLTHRFVAEVSPYSTKILATRKTLPGLRLLQLRAVQAGGGWIHRESLRDGILIKENHQQFSSAAEILNRARALRSPLHRIEIEVQDLAMLKEVLRDPPDVLMLDNLGPAAVKSALELIDGKCEVEISGGIQLENVRALAEMGVDYISVGQLTHSVKALDLSMDFL